MQKLISKTSKTAFHRLFIRAASFVLLLFLLNKIIYAAIVPAIFFHGVYHADDEQFNQNQQTVKEIRMDSLDNHLYGWSYGNNPDSVILYLGGDSADSNAWIRSAVLQHQDCWKDHTVLTVDYPTFGKSEGTISEYSFYKTAESLYRYAKEVYPNARVFTMGYSIGSAAALYLAHLYSVDGLILIAPMYDATSIYLPRDGALYSFFEPVATVQMQNEYFAKSYEGKTLVLASEKDGMMKLEDITALCDSFPNQPLLIKDFDCTHGEFWEQKKVYREISAFLKSDFTAVP